MTESEFETLAGAALAALERAFEANAPDADVQSKGEGLLEIEFDDGRCVAGVVVWSKGANAGIKFDTPLGPNDALLVD